MEITFCLDCHKAIEGPRVGKGGYITLLKFLRPLLIYVEDYYAEEAK